MIFYGVLKGKVHLHQRKIHHSSLEEESSWRLHAKPKSRAFIHQRRLPTSSNIKELKKSYQTGSGACGLAMWKVPTIVAPWKMQENIFKFCNDLDSKRRTNARVEAGACFFHRPNFYIYLKSCFDSILYADYRSGKSRPVSVRLASPSKGHGSEHKTLIWRLVLEILVIDFQWPVQWTRLCMRPCIFKSQPVWKKLYV